MQLISEAAFLMFSLGTFFCSVYIMNKSSQAHLLSGLSASFSTKISRAMINSDPCIAHEEKQKCAKNLSQGLRNLP